MQKKHLIKKILLLKYVKVDIKMAEDVEFTFPHKHITNVSPCGTILTANQPKTGRRTLTQPRL